MLRNVFSSLLALILLAISLNFASAQDIVVTTAEMGVVVEHPSNWLFKQDRDNRLDFSNSTMEGQIEFELLEDIDEDYLEFLEEWVEVEEDNDGEFSDIETYNLEDGWNAARALRIRTDDRLFEVLLTAEVRDYAVYLEATFRIGSQDFYLPHFDAIVNSVRNIDDRIELATGSRAQTPPITGHIGLINEPLNIGVLNTNFVTDDELYQFEYPGAWDLRVNDDGSIVFIETGDITLFGTLSIAQHDATDTSDDLVLDTFGEADVDVEPFMLNDLSASRIVIVDETNNIRRVVMASVRGNIQTIFDVTIDFATSETVDATLRAILYSVRPNGEPFTLTVMGDAVRAGLTSANIYGTAIIPEVELADGMPLDASIVTLNGQYTLDYPLAWFSEILQGSIVLSSEENYFIYDPDRGEVQMIITFFDQISNLAIDDFSPQGVLEFAIANDSDPDDWGKIEIFDSVGRAGAYADLDLSSGNVGRTYFVEIDDARDIFVRLELIVDEDGIDIYHQTAMAILNTARFQD